MTIVPQEGKPKYRQRRGVFQAVASRHLLTGLASIVAYEEEELEDSSRLDCVLGCHIDQGQGDIRR